MGDVATLADDLLALIVQEDPLAEMVIGFPGSEDKLPDHSESAEQELRAAASAVMAAVPADGGSDPITAAVVSQQAGALIDRLDARLADHVMTDYSFAPALRLLTILPLTRPADADAERAFFRRLAAVPGYLETVAERNRTGVAAGRLPVADRAEHLVRHLDGYLADPAGDLLLRVPVADSAERDRLLLDVVRPAFARYRDVVAAEVVPRGRPADQPGLCWIPGGDSAYAGLVRMHTTTDRTPQELHDTGLELIAALADEYVEIGSRAFGLHTLEEIRARLRSDPALRWGSAEEVLADATAAIERAETAAPRWFGLEPAHRCVLEPVPEVDAPNAPSAYYLPATADGSRRGTYYVNTHQATERDRTVSEATAFHEAVPGHHFQVSISQERVGLPALRRLAAINSFAEGWGLYSERLADEMGLYSDDVARLGMLGQDSVRAARLVVDTGLHAFGWSRQQVVDHLRANTVMSEVEVQHETDRYIEAPGQALSYMVGRLEFQRIRARAAAALGEAFDVRAFHDVVLGGGTIPMDVLDRLVAAWTAEQTTC